MCQGSLTTTPMLIADELDATLDSVKVEQDPANPALYKNPVTGTQSYGGSRGVRDHLAMWRKAAAAAREMLAQAAADEWGVPVESVETEQGAVVHRPSGRRLLYGQLVDRAQQVPVPQNPTLKSPDKFRYIGKPVKRRDTPEKITGRGIYGTDVQVPGMLVASRSEEHTSELQSRLHLVCRLLLEKKKKQQQDIILSGVHPLNVVCTRAHAVPA